MTYLPRYDELHVVSDLHLGGARGFQIFKHGKRLANFIRWVGQQRPGERIGLVLNGDVIDSLAEDIGGYIATSDAASMVERIIDAQAFSPVWEALQAFVGAPGRSLIVVIGNHDLDLALPAVQHTGILSVGETGVTDGAVAQDMVLTEILGPALLSEVAKARSASAPVDDMLRQAEEHFDKPRMYNARSHITLGWPELVWDKLTGVEKPEALRRALQDWLRGDKTFDISDRDGTFEAVMAKVGPAVDVVVTGPTHLERAIALDSRRCYFNCGTWIRLLRFTETILDDPMAFREVYDVLMDGTRERIDQAGQRFAIDQTSAVCIRAEGGETVSELVHVEGENHVTRKLVTDPFRRR